MLSLFTILRRNPQRVGLRPGEVVLTFDDGPNSKDNVTTDLLTVLDGHSVRAGFCVVGNQVCESPEIVRRMHDSGHLLINHTQQHHHPARQKYAAMLADVIACDEQIGRALGIADYQSEFFRAPFGIVTPAVRKVCRTLDMTHVLLTHYGWDTRVGPNNFQPVVDTMIANAIRCNGGMFVFHDGRLSTSTESEPEWSQSADNRTWIPEAVDRVISDLRSSGLRFVVPAKRATNNRLTQRCAS